MNTALIIIAIAMFINISCMFVAYRHALRDHKEKATGWVAFGLASTFVLVISPVFLMDDWEQITPLIYDGAVINTACMLLAISFVTTSVVAFIDTAARGIKLPAPVAGSIYGFLSVIYLVIMMLGIESPWMIKYTMWYIFITLVYHLAYLNSDNPGNAQLSDWDKSPL